MVEDTVMLVVEMEVLVVVEALVEETVVEVLEYLDKELTVLLDTDHTKVAVEVVLVVQVVLVQEEVDYLHQ